MTSLCRDFPFFFLLFFSYFVFCFCVCLFLFQSTQLIAGTATYYTSNYMQCVTNPLIEKGKYALTISNNNVDFTIGPTGSLAPNGTVLTFTSAPAIIRFTTQPSTLVPECFFRVGVEVLSNDNEVVVQTFHVAVRALYHGGGGEALATTLVERSVAKGSGAISDVLFSIEEEVALGTVQLQVDVVSEPGIQSATTDAISVVDCPTVREHSIVMEGVCRCGPGYGASNLLDLSSPCLPCPMNTYKNSTGDEACAPCPSATLAPSTPTAATHCVCAETMVPRVWAEDGTLEECTCTAGSTQDSQGLCSACPFGT